MSFDRPEDNKKMKRDPEDPYTVIRVPTVYLSFELLKGSVLKEAEDKRLVVEKDGELQEYWLDGSMDVVYLTKKEFADPDTIVSIGTANGSNPFGLILGKTIDWVNMYSDKFYNRQRLAMQTFIGSYSCTLPLEVFLYYDDGAVMLNVTPSEKLIKKFSGDIMRMDPHDWTGEDIKAMAVMRPLWGMQTLKRVNIFDPLSEQEFVEGYPEAYSRILDTEAEMKAKKKDGRTNRVQ